MDLERKVPMGEAKAWVRSQAYLEDPELLVNTVPGYPKMNWSVQSRCVKGSQADDDEGEGYCC
eukprot:8255443-Ditylum_brightwellii.AAC.1